MTTSSRVLYPAFRDKIMSAEQAATFIQPGDNVGMSGFTGSGQPKVVPGALAKRIAAAHARGEEFRVNVWTGASTSPDLDGELAAVDGIGMRLPYQSDSICRQKSTKALCCTLTSTCHTWRSSFGLAFTVH